MTNNWEIVILGAISALCGGRCVLFLAFCASLVRVSVGSQGALPRVGVGQSNEEGEGSLDGKIYVPLEMGAWGRVRLKHVFCCTAGDEAGRLSWRSRGKREDLQLTYLLPCSVAIGASGNECWTFGLGECNK